MSNARSAAALLAEAHQGLSEIGYSGGLLRENYEFADFFTTRGEIRSIPLAAFTQEPPSYKTAGIGVTYSDRDEPEAPAPYRALGAPQILVLHPQVVRRWKVGSTGEPELLEEFASDELLRTLRDNRDDWGPSRLLQIKSKRFDLSPRQLDFYDTSLLPVLDEIAYRKLDRLLQDTLSASMTVYGEHHPENPTPPHALLFRLIFRLLAAKLFADRRHEGNWLHSDPRDAIAAVERFYFQHETPEPVLDHFPTQEIAWRKLRSAFHFQNISVDALAHVYENTFVTPEWRREYGTHSTPHLIAEHLVRLLPFETLPENERRVFEPFAGQAAFLLAALDRLRGLLPPEMDSTIRHQYFVRMLAGMEIEPFAVEVSRLSLMLADYPNPNGWRLLQGDVFRDQRAAEELQRAQIVLCNPPFEDFTPKEQPTYHDLPATNKALAILRQVLDRRPSMLGFVLPKSFINGPKFREARRELINSYSDVQLIALPDKVFAHAEAEPVLLLAHGSPSDSLHLHVASVDKADYARFQHSGETSTQASALFTSEEALALPSLWLNPLARVWEALSQYPMLDSIADLHRGIEYNISMKDNAARLVSAEPRAGFARGLLHVTEGFEPYRVGASTYLNMDPSLMLYQAYRLPWESPKVIVNAARRSRGPWRLTAAPDATGLVCYQRFLGIWPLGDLSVDVLAAVLNGPLANAFISLREVGRDNRKTTLQQIPMPRFSREAMGRIKELVGEYRDWRELWLRGMSTVERGHRLLLEIDAEVLAAYDLPPRLERQVLQFFSGYQRPAPMSFVGYYPSGFDSALPLRLVVEGAFSQATGRETLARLPVIDDPIISAVVAGLESQ